MFLCTRLVTDVPGLSVAPLASTFCRAECEFLSEGPPPLLRGGPKTAAWPTVSCHTYARSGRMRGLPRSPVGPPGTVLTTYQRALTERANAATCGVTPPR